MDIKKTIQKSIEIKNSVLNNQELISRISHSIDVIVHSLIMGGKIHFCGNGGSAADAQHLAAELSGRFYYNRPPLNAEALHCNTSYLTAVANDFGYDHIFSRLLEATAHKGDVLVVLSTSGNSKNIIEAVHYAKNNDLVVISLTGQTGGLLTDISDILINVPSTDTPRIQEVHIMIGHIICEQVESIIYPKI
jgi:D-sedoheptulose 7-phosphate isomerase